MPGHSLPHFQPAAFGSSSAAAFSPSDVAGLIGWFDAQQASSFTIGAANEVTAADNLTGLSGIVASPYGGPTYAASEPTANGHPALVWPSTTNRLGLEQAEDSSASEVFIVAAYKDGLDAAFDEYTTFVTSFAGMTANTGQRIMGEQSGSGFWTGSFLTSVSINGAAPTASVLPAPLSVLHFSAPATPILVANIGGRNGTHEKVRAWQGAICEVLIYSDQVALTTGDVDLVNDYLMQKWGIT